MDYKRLHYEQYFIDTSQNYHETDKVRNEIEYQAVYYQRHKLEKLFHIYHEVNYALVYDEPRNTIQIHFEKSHGNMDWFTNIAEFAGKYYDAFLFEDEYLELHVHNGWGAMYKTIKKDIRREWCSLKEAHPDAFTEVIGWSLGSSQAMLCCQDLNWNYGERPYIYTFGSVKPFRTVHGNDAQLERYLQQICSGCYNFANRNDLVTYMPPFKGYRMIDRKTVGLDTFSLRRLLNPNWYHVIYNQAELYKRKGQ